MTKTGIPHAITMRPVFLPLSNRWPSSCAKRVLTNRTMCANRHCPSYIGSAQSTESTRLSAGSKAERILWTTDRPRMKAHSSSSRRWTLSAFDATAENRSTIENLSPVKHPKNSQTPLYPPSTLSKNHKIKNSAALPDCKYTACSSV